MEKIKLLDGRITLICGNSLEILPKLKKGIVNAVVTDPPYKITSGGNTSGQMTGGIFDPEVYNNNGKIVGDSPKFTDWFPLIYDLNTNLEVFTMTNDKNLQDMLNAATDAKFKLHNVLLWDKGIPTPNRWFMKSVEFTCYFWRGRARNINDMGAQQYQRIKPKIGNRLHPTEKPIELMRVYIENATNENDYVLDPFMGSGSTGVACINTNRKFIGIEKEKKHFDTAVEQCMLAIKDLEKKAA